MKVVQLGRNDLYVVLSMTYQAMAIAPKVIELGVLRGDNALVMHRALPPDLMPMPRLRINSCPTEKLSMARNGRIFVSHER